MKNRRVLLIATCVALGISIAAMSGAVAAETARSFRAGAFLVDISPTNFPIIVNGMFTERSATNTADPIHARSLVLDDGVTRIAITVVDTCMMSRDLIDRAKDI